MSLHRLAEHRSTAGRHHLDDATTLAEITQRMLADYHVAVAGDEPREDLVRILTGIAGCVLATSCCYAATGFAQRPRPYELSHAETTRLGGLLVQEVAHAAAEGWAYRGVRAVEYQRPAIAEALRNVSIAYVGMPSDSATVADRLNELAGAAVDVAGGQGAETLAALAGAHRRAVERAR